LKIKKKLIYIFFIIKKIFYYFFYNKKIKTAKIIYFSEKADWAIKFVGQSMEKAINNQNNNLFFVTHHPYYLKDKIIHFGSQYMWLEWKNYYKNKNFIIVSFLHGKNQDGPLVEKHISNFIESSNDIDIIICSNDVVKFRLINWGIKKDKIFKVPLGVDLKNFPRLSYKTRNKYKIKFNIPNNKFIIGSFQKDGNGWKEGNQPKLIKGPDIFISIVKRIAKIYDIHIILTGPARGYVINELKKNKIDFSHFYELSYAEMYKYYNLLDLYIVSSREEGGPLSILESMSCGVPIVSSKVGIANELIQDSVNGFLCEINDIDDYTKKIMYLKKITQDQKEKIVKNAETTVTNYDWSILSKNYINYFKEHFK